MNGDFCIRIRPLENGYTVEVPDAAEIEKRKKAQKGGGTPYLGDATKTMIAKNSGEVLKLVKEALAGLPETVYADAFAEAAKSATKGM